jgi:uncharacterized protein
MELQGTVLNVVDFGAFVDIGLHDTGLVHISQLANRYVRDPHDVVSVGDIVKVWVHEIDKGRRRVSLTMVAPGTERAAPPRRGEKRKKRDGGRKHGAAPQADRAPQGVAAPTAEQASATTAPAAAPPTVAASAALDRRPRPPQGRDKRAARRPDRPGGAQKPKSHPPRTRTQRREAAPLVPLTKEMKAGKAPLRTFGDLKQFFEMQSNDTPEEPHGEPPA